MTFGEKFKAYRDEKGVSAYRIAKLTGVHPSYISNVEAGRRPMSEEFIQRLCQKVPDLALSPSLLRAWQIIDRFDPEEIKLASELSANEARKRA